MTTSRPNKVTNTVTRVEASQRPRRTNVDGQGPRRRRHFRQRVFVKCRTHACAHQILHRFSMIWYGVESKGHVPAVVLNVLAYRHRLDLLQREHEWRVVAQVALQFLVPFESFGTVDLYAMPLRSWPSIAGSTNRCATPRSCFAAVSELSAFRVKNSIVELASE